MNEFAVFEKGETVMKRTLPLLLWLVAMPLAAQDAKDAGPPMPFRVVENFLKLPDGVYMAEVVGVSVDSKGRVVVANRGKLPLRCSSSAASAVSTSST
jgi:hypothetical protein